MPDGPSSPSASSVPYSPEAVEVFRGTVDAFENELDRRARAVAEARDHEIVLKDDVSQAESEMRVQVETKAKQVFRLIGPVLLGVGITEVLQAAADPRTEISIFFVLILVGGVGFTMYTLSG